MSFSSSTSSGGSPFQRGVLFAFVVCAFLASIGTSLSLQKEVRQKRFPVDSKQTKPHQNKQRKESFQSIPSLSDLASTSEWASFSSLALPSSTFQTSHSDSYSFSALDRLNSGISFSKQASIVRNITSKTVGSYTQPGLRWKEKGCNQDAIDVETLRIQPPSSSLSDDTPLSVTIIRAFDGHGSDDRLPKRHIPGQSMANQSLKIHRTIMNEQLFSILKAPVMEHRQANFKTSSRQAKLAKTLGEITDQLPYMWGGTTATVVMTLQFAPHHYPNPGWVSYVEDKKSRFQQPVLVMSANLGDSRAVVYSFRRDESTDKYYPCTSIQLTEEENIKEESQRRKVTRRLRRAGYSHRIVANGDVLFEKPSEVAAWKRRQRKGIRQGMTMNMFRMNENYLQSYKVEGYPGKFKWHIQYLQPSACLGDYSHDPAKRSKQSPRNVRVVPLVYDPNVISIIVVATDGLWQADDLQNKEKRQVFRYLSLWLNRHLAEITKPDPKSPSPSKRLAMKLAELADEKSDDDASIVVSIHNQMAIADTLVM